MKRVVTAAVCLAIGAVAIQVAAQEPFLSWSSSKAEAVGRAMYVRGRVGGLWDNRVIDTDRSYNYKLAATWMTPEVIRATARMRQLGGRLSDADTLKLVEEARTADATVVMVEIDPREGSGVIPLDWEAFLRPRGAEPARVVRGVNTPRLRDVPAFAGVLRRDYAYDRFWVVFPLTTSEGASLFRNSDTEAELIVRIYEKEGRVQWQIPSSIRAVQPAKSLTM